MRLSGFAPLVLWLVLLAGSATAADPFLRRTVTVSVVERAGPAVVNITTERVVAGASPFSTTSATSFARTTMRSSRSWRRKPAERGPTR